MKRVKIKLSGILFAFVLAFSIPVSVWAVQETDLEQMNITADGEAIESTGASEEFENAIALAIGGSVSNTITEDNRERIY